MLRERCYQMTHNSFLLHGYYNYKTFPADAAGDSGEVKYYIGVPGNFYAREKQVAGMFGFESFEGARETTAWDGDFGYYRDRRWNCERISSPRSSNSGMKVPHWRQSLPGEIPQFNANPFGKS